MKTIRTIILLAAVLMTGCLTIDDEPLINLDPTVDFQAHIRSSKLYVTATVLANATYVNPGNMSTIFEYEGEVQMMNEITGTVVSLNTISGNELTKVVTVSADTTSVSGFVVIADGLVTVYADKDDGGSSNDILISSAEFHGEAHISFLEPQE